MKRVMGSTGLENKGSQRYANTINISPARVFKHPKLIRESSRGEDFGT